MSTDEKKDDNAKPFWMVPPEYLDETHPNAPGTGPSPSGGEAPPPPSNHGRGVREVPKRDPSVTDDPPRKIDVFGVDDDDELETFFGPEAEGEAEDDE